MHDLLEYTLEAPPKDFPGHLSMRYSFHDKSLLRPLWLILIFVTLTTGYLFESFAGIETKLLDVEFRLLRKIVPRGVARDVVVVGIDVDDLRRFNDPKDFWHPHYGRFLETLATAKPAVVGIDVVFPERSYHTLVPGIDQQLLKGLATLREVAPIVIARTVDDFNAFRQIFPPYIAAAGADSVGSVIVCRDEDEVIRRFDEFLCDGKRIEAIPSLTGLMAMHMGVEQEWRGIVNFAIGDRINYIPIRDVIDWGARKDPRLLTVFQDQPVLLGFILPFEDRKSVPVDIAGREPGNQSVPGVIVHAQILRSMLNGGLISSAPHGLVVLLIALGAAFWWPPSNLMTRFAIVVVLGALLTAATLSLYLHMHLPVAAPMIAVLVGAGSRYIKSATDQARERALLRNSFGGYVSPQIMNEILTGNLHPGLVGERRTVCILFSDIRDFTRRSEHMTPEALIEMLNQYFTEMTQVIHENHGTVDKFIGDGMMAFFGAPQRLDSPAQHAVNSALLMLERVEALNQTLATRKQEPLRIGIGLHLGEVIIGHVGSSSRHEYTAIGDPVNTASRVEGLTKDAGYALLITQSVYEVIANKHQFTDLGSREIRGRSSVNVYGFGPYGVGVQPNAFPTPRPDEIPVRESQ